MGDFRIWMTSTPGRVFGAFVFAGLLHLVGSLLIPGYSSTFAIRAMLVIASLLAIASIGQTLVVILGAIDLSIPFIIGFANVVAAQLMAKAGTSHWSAWWSGSWQR
jgi:ribose transport system permease protein